MSEEKKYIEQDEQQEESSIDFMKLFEDVKKHRKLYYKVLPVTFVVAAILALSIPNYYNCQVKLSPEMSGSSSKSGLLSLASSFGVNPPNSSGLDTVSETAPPCPYHQNYPDSHQKNLQD